MSGADARPGSPGADEPVVQLAHALLKKFEPGAAFDGEPFMLVCAGTFNGDRYVAANCFYHTVLSTRDRALLFTREEGSMVPWVEFDGGEAFPDIDYLVKVVRLPQGGTKSLLDRHDATRLAALSEAALQGEGREGEMKIFGRQVPFTQKPEPEDESVYTKSGVVSGSGGSSSHITYSSPPPFAYDSYDDVARSPQSQAEFFIRLRDRVGHEQQAGETFGDVMKRAFYVAGQEFRPLEHLKALERLTPTWDLATASIDVKRALVEGAAFCKTRDSAYDVGQFICGLDAVAGALVREEKPRHVFDSGPAADVVARALIFLDARVHEADRSCALERIGRDAEQDMQYRQELQRQRPEVAAMAEQVVEEVKEKAAADLRGLDVVASDPERARQLEVMGWNADESDSYRDELRRLSPGVARLAEAIQGWVHDSAYQDGRVGEQDWEALMKRVRDLGDGREGYEELCKRERSEGELADVSNNSEP